MQIFSISNRRMSRSVAQLLSLFLFGDPAWFPMCLRHDTIVSAAPVDCRNIDAESADDREFMCSYSALRSNGNTLALCQPHHAKQLKQGSTSVLPSDTSFPFKPFVALCFFVCPQLFTRPAAFCLRSSDARDGCTAGDDAASHRFLKHHLIF